MPVPALVAHRVTRRLGRVLALDAVSLEVAAGVVHGLVGPNGAGKTTFLGLALGLAAPTSGRVEVLGTPVPPPGRVPVPGVGGCVETPRFYPQLSLRANLRLLGRLDGLVSGRGLARRIEDRLDLVGLREVADVRVRELSLGMRQRLGIAAALLGEVRLLVLDEPVNGLDPAGMAETRALLRRLAADGITVVLSSHHIVALESACDSVTVLRAGRPVFDGTMDAMRRQAPRPAFRLHTSHDATALALLGVGSGPGPSVRADGSGLLVHADRDDLDALVLRLGRAGIAVRRLQPLASPLEALFAELTGVPLSPDADAVRSGSSSSPCSSPSCDREPDEAHGTLAGVTR